MGTCASTQPEHKQDSDHSDEKQDLFTKYVDQNQRFKQKLQAKDKTAMFMMNPMVLVICIGKYSDIPDLPLYILPAIDRDAQNLHTLFVDKLNYKIHPETLKTEWTQEEVIDLLTNKAIFLEQNLLQSDIKYDGLIVFITGHGQNSNIITSDGQRISKTAIHRIFTVVGSAVREIPRLFFYDVDDGPHTKVMNDFHDENVDDHEDILWTDNTNNPDHKLVLFHSTTDLFHCEANRSVCTSFIHCFIREIIESKNNKSYLCEIFDRIQNTYHSDGKQLPTSMFTNDTRNIIFKMNKSVKKKQKSKTIYVQNPMVIFISNDESSIIDQNLSVMQQLCIEMEWKLEKLIFPSYCTKQQLMNGLKRHSKILYENVRDGVNDGLLVVVSCCGNGNEIMCSKDEFLNQTDLYRVFSKSQLREIPRLFIFDIDINSEETRFDQKYTITREKYTKNKRWIRDEWWYDNESHPDHKLGIISAANKGYVGKMNRVTGSYMIYEFVNKMMSSLRKTNKSAFIFEILDEMQNELELRGKQLPVFTLNNYCRFIKFAVNQNEDINYNNIMPNTEQQPYALNILNYNMWLISGYMKVKIHIKYVPNDVMNVLVIFCGQIITQKLPLIWQKLSH